MIKDTVARILVAADVAGSVLHSGIAAAVDWYFRSLESAASVVVADRTASIIDPAKKIYSMALYGNDPNTDIWLGDTL